MTENTKKQRCIILYPGRGLNDYIRGRIAGIIHVLIGMPEVPYGWVERRSSGIEYMLFECTDEQYQTIIDQISCYKKNDQIRYLRPQTMFV